MTLRPKLAQNKLLWGVLTNSETSSDVKCRLGGCGLLFNSVKDLILSLKVMKIVKIHVKAFNCCLFVCFMLSYI